ncbi:MAG: DNA primase regulatory subunit PriL [Candidatus Methanoperedens sp.]|nr:DNA primase regulatory subunit PriL [Candidatus Methanoperedens sp.]
MDVLDFANFPFTNCALRYVEGLDFQLDELFSELAFEGVRVRGKERVLQAMGDGIAKPDISDETDAKMELLSYPVARILVSCINDTFLTRRYSLAEAKSAHELFKNLSLASLKELASDFNIDITIGEHISGIHFTDYVRFAVREPRWKLINRNMDHGTVQISNKEFARIMEEAARKRIESNLPADVPPGICTVLEDAILEIRGEMEARRTEFSIDGFKEIMPDCFPPCVVHALSGACSGVNLTHTMRFALTSFLLNIGMNVDGIIDLFNVSPDFDEEKTRYQVMHIQGATGTAYKSPSCSTMLTYGNCIGKDSVCERISHPLGYYSKKAWLTGKGKDDEIKDMVLQDRTKTLNKT